jgi:hypothetical protein
MNTWIRLRPVFRFLIALFSLILFSTSGRAAEVWIGGSRAWGDFTAPGGAKQWTFLQENVDGFYINNFSMRPNESKSPTREPRVAGMYHLLKNKRIFYETDLIHSTDDFDRQSIALFLKQGFEYTGTTINYGTSAARTSIITQDGKLPLYYMFGPWNGEGDISKPKNNDLRTQIRKYTGAAVDDPVTMWRGPNGHKDTRSMVYSTIKWCHANKQKFLFLLAPNDSGKTFLSDAQQLVRNLEDNNANPDLWAVEFYGPQSFRDLLETLPESDADGRPADTFSGVPYWLIHHLRDPEKWARLSLPTDQTKAAAGGMHDVEVDLSNSSDWLELTPVVRLRPMKRSSSDVRVTMDHLDVTAEMLGDGLVFNRQRRLEPGTSRRLILHFVCDQSDTDSPGLYVLDLLPNPSEPKRVNQTFIIHSY